MCKRCPDEALECDSACETALSDSICFEHHAKSCTGQAFAIRTAKRGGGELAAALDELSPYLRSDDDLESHLDIIALQEAVERFLRSLPKEHRNVFLSRYYSMQPIAEIAASHGSTVGRVKMILKRTKEKMRTFLKEEGFL